MDPRPPTLLKKCGVGVDPPPQGGKNPHFLFIFFFEGFPKTNRRPTEDQQKTNRRPTEDQQKTKRRTVEDQQKIDRRLTENQKNTNRKPTVDRQ